MTTRSASIAALLARGESDLRRIETEYNSSLESRAIAADLKIDVKNLFENLRSVLDYLAHDIREKYCPSAKHGERFYFPIVADLKQFESQVARWYPDLKVNSRVVWDLLESFQPYHPAYSWLGYFNLVNNENKHGDLVEQTRSETHEIRATSAGGGMVSWNPEAVTFGSGVFINGVPVNPLTQMPVPHPSQRVERIVWVDFRFAGVDVSALQLMKQAVAGTRSIEAALRPHV